MKVASLSIQNFRRFTDLTIDNIPATTQVVVIAGVNGCGKSSLFDAFTTWYQVKFNFGVTGDANYNIKDTKTGFDFHRNISITFHDTDSPKRGCVYYRTAYRNDPDFRITTIAKQDSPIELLTARRSIDTDQTVARNYSTLIYETLSTVYNQENDDYTISQVRKKLIGDLQESLRNVFGDLILESINDPLGEGTFLFSKGNTKNYHYKNLSGGEKSAFDLLLDIHMKKKYFNNTIYCIDEIETHVHTRIQSLLFREIARIIPPNCQLWISTHSLGVIREAQLLNHKHPGTVAIFDFDSLDPDKPSVISPSNLDRMTWEKLLSIALDDYSFSIVPKYVVICEGSIQGSRRKNFDAEIYNRVIGLSRHDIVFVSGGGSNELESSSGNAINLLKHMIPNAKVVTLRDRDDLSDKEVQDLKQKKIYVLGRRHLESYLFDDEVLAKLACSSNKTEKTSELCAAMREILEGNIQNKKPKDDIKYASGLMYNKIKQILELSRCGSNTDSFMKDTLAPLLTVDMRITKELTETICCNLPFND